MSKVLQGEKCILRPWQLGDAIVLAAIANRREIWVNLGDDFPFPYTEDDADDWCRRCQEAPMLARSFAVEVAGRLAGGAGFSVGEGVFAHTARVGYWLGTAFWGQGIGTEIAGLITDYAFGEDGIARCQAHVYGWNPASARVLEKAGYLLEGRMGNGVFKDGRYTDLLTYGRLREG